MMTLFIIRCDFVSRETTESEIKKEEKKSEKKWKEKSPGIHSRRGVQD
jgi:hypothetical protein